ncbi:MAG: hypothetical protein AAGE96_01625 [Cyanobacteria bacterium P01_G01_bin.19]
MFKNFARLLAILLSAIVFSASISVASVNATTFSFKSPGKQGNEGVFSGKITYDRDAVELSLRDSQKETNSLTLEQLGKDSEFTFEYISPYSGVKHSQDTICERDIGGDINNSDKPDLSFVDKEGPFFQFDSPEDLASFNLISCVGNRGELDSEISDRDLSVAFSELQIIFGQARLIDADYTGVKSGRRYTKKFPIYIKREAQ